MNKLFYLKNAAIRDYKVIFCHLKNAVVWEQYDYEKLKADALAFVNHLNTSGFDYKFSQSAQYPTLYSSVYACMLKGLFNSIDPTSAKDWASYFDLFQRDNGLFYDPNCKNKYYEDGDGWGARHLLPHVIIAYNRLGALPKREFSFLLPYCDADYILDWLNTRDFNNAWETSNQIMNIGCALLYARDYMNLKSQHSIEALQEWLLSHIREDCGMWKAGSIDNKDSMYDALRAAYHIYPILYYDGIKIPYAEKAVEIILGLQNRWGGFSACLCSNACCDIDAIDPLIRLSNQENLTDKAQKAIKRAFKWVMANQNPDGGFVFSRGEPFSYGGEKNLSSMADESNLFGTWFRILSILYIQSFLEVKKLNFTNLPSYEFSIY